MEKIIINNWDKNKEKLKEYFKNTSQYDYAWGWSDFIKAIVRYSLPDFSIKEYKMIGSYQGEIKITIEDENNNIYKGMTYYGTCSFCDSLLAIYGGSVKEIKPNNNQLSQYMNLALQIIQTFKKDENL